MKMKPSVAVVILNWNGQGLLKKFLPSVLKTDYPNLQIIVGDNASTDNSISLIEKEFPTIKIIVNDKNYGFAGGYNEILKQVNADYFVLLNSDVEVPTNWITPVIELMESDSLIGAAQPKIKSQKHKNNFEYAGAAGGFMDRNVFPFCRGRIFDNVEADEHQYETNIEIFWASGAALFIKSNVWREIGGLDADFFAHMEEIDICWRLKNRGYKIMCCVESEVYHLGGGTLNTNNPYKTYLNFRNNLMIMQKNLPKGEAYWKIFIRIWIDFVAWFHFLVTGKPKFTWAVSKAHFHFFKALRKTGKKRDKSQLSFNQHIGVYPKSIVWNFFINNIKRFSDLK